MTDLLFCRCKTHTLNCATNPFSRGFRAKYIEELNRCLDMDGAAGSGGGDPSDPRHDGDPSRINEEDGDEAAGDAMGDHCDHGSNSTDEGITR